MRLRGRKALSLPPYIAFIHHKAITEKNIQTSPRVKVKPAQALKSAFNWIIAEVPENLTTKETIIRAALVVSMPVLSAIDWNFGTRTLYFIAPAIFYLEVTAFTMYYRIKAIFSHDSYAPRLEQ